MSSEGALSARPGRRAMQFRRSGSSPMSVASTPLSWKYSSSTCAAAVSLPGGLLVSARISFASRSTTSSSRSAYSRSVRPHVSTAASTGLESAPGSLPAPVCTTVSVRRHVHHIRFAAESLPATDARAPAVWGEPKPRHTTDGASVGASVFPDHGLGSSSRDPCENLSRRARPARPVAPSSRAAEVSCRGVAPSSRAAEVSCRGIAASRIDKGRILSPSSPTP